MLHHTQEFQRVAGGDFESRFERVQDNLEQVIKELNRVQAYASIWVEGGATALSLAAADTWYKITAFTDDGEENECTADSDNDRIIITRGGLYEVSFSGVLVITTTARTVKLSLFSSDGDTQHKQCMCGKLSNAASDLANVFFRGLERFDAGDELEIHAKCVGNTTNITVQDANLTIVRLGP